MARAVGEDANVLAFRHGKHEVSGFCPIRLRVDTTLVVADLAVPIVMRTIGATPAVLDDPGVYPVIIPYDDDTMVCGRAGAFIDPIGGIYGGIEGAVEI